MSPSARLRRPPRGALLSLLAVFAGGAVGTFLRLLVDGLIPHGDDAFPVSTLVVNVIGSFALGYLVARVWPTASNLARAALGPGLLGAFTTFSAVVVSMISLSQAGEFWIASLYLACTLVLGFGAAAGGLVLGARHLAEASASGGSSDDSGSGRRPGDARGGSPDPSAPPTIGPDE